MFTDQAGKIASQARIIVDLLRLVRTLRSEYEGLSLVLSVSLEQGREQDRRIASSRERYLSLLAQHRALMSGRTHAEERQALEGAEDAAVWALGEQRLAETERAA